MEFFHPMFTRNGVRNLKDIKRGNQMKKQALVTMCLFSKCGSHASTLFYAHHNSEQCPPAL